MERTTVEHLLERPCFIDSGQCPRSAPILLGYEPSYRSFQKGPTVEGSSPSTSETMLVKRRSIDIGTELGTSVLQTSETSTLPFAPGSSEGESVAKRRKIGEEEAEEASGLRAFAPTEPSVPKSLSKKGKGKNSRTPQKATGDVSYKRKDQKESPAPWSCEFYMEGRPVNEGDSVWESIDVRGGQIADAVGRALLLPKDVRAWQRNNSAQMVENLKRDSVVVGPVIFLFFCFFVFVFFFFFLF